MLAVQGHEQAVCLRHLASGPAQRDDTAGATAPKAPAPQTMTSHPLQMTRQAVQGHEQALCLRLQTTSLTQCHDTVAQGHQATFGPQHNDASGMSSCDKPPAYGRRSRCNAAMRRAACSLAQHARSGERWSARQMAPSQPLSQSWPDGAAYGAQGARSRAWRAARGSRQASAQSGDSGAYHQY